MNLNAKHLIMRKWNTVFIARDLPFLSSYTLNTY